MENRLTELIRSHRPAGTQSPLPPVVDESVVWCAENSLGFSLPPLIRGCYLRVADGGFGPGYGVFGVAGGNDGDFGSLIDEYQVMKEDYKAWPQHLLPLCDWGCNTISCVDCSTPPYQMFLFEEGEINRCSYDLEQFFILWLGGVDIRGFSRDGFEEVEFINPFSGKNDLIRKPKGV